MHVIVLLSHRRAFSILKLVSTQANTSPSTSRKVKDSADLERLKEIFFQLQDVRDDSQQRGWAVHDDLKVIMDYLSELLQILVRFTLLREASSLNYLFYG